MSASWILLDATNACHRMWYGISNLTSKGLDTNVIYGFLRDIYFLETTLNIYNIAFCFDSHEMYLRSTLYPDYKAGRNHGDRQSLYRQMNALREEILPIIGFRNVFMVDGFEADDLIASICKEKGSYRTIVSTDKDLYQLLSPKVNVWNPITKKFWTWNSFHAQYGILPGQWPIVKAIGGCKGDNIPGARKVGEATAIKYVQGMLPKDSPRVDRIAESQELIERNMKLVTLPWPGLKRPHLKMDNLSAAGWQEVLNKYEMQSLASKPPWGLL